MSDKIRLHEPRVGFREPFSFAGDDSPNATWKWEIAFQKGDKSAIDLLEKMDRAHLGDYYRARSQMFHNLKEQSIPVGEDAEENYGEVALALHNDDSDTQLIRNATVTLGFLQSTDKPSVGDPKHRLSEVHEKAKSFLI